MDCGESILEVRGGVEQKKEIPESLISVAPMLDVTNTHFRRLCRIISEKTQLWTEMVVDDTIIHCFKDESRRRLLEEVYLKKSEIESPLVLQLGGNMPEKIQEAIEIAVKYGFRSFNLNVGCPSCKVATKGNFGASLFKTPLRVAAIVNKANLKLNQLGLVGSRISVKTRIGVDSFDSYDHLFSFISLVSGVKVTNETKTTLVSLFETSEHPLNQEELDSVNYDNGSFLGAETFIIHARKAWLNGINPSKNRKIPNLNYPWVYRLTLDFPTLTFVLNGGVTTIEQALSLLNGNWFLEYRFGQIQNRQEVIQDDTNIGDKDSQDGSHSDQSNKRIKTEHKYPEDNQNPLHTKETEYVEEVYEEIKSGRWNQLKGVMIGREVMNNPFILSRVDQNVYGKQNSEFGVTRREVLEKYCDYLGTVRPRKEKASEGSGFSSGELHGCLKPVFGIFHGHPGTKHWRRILSELIKKDNGGPEDILRMAISLFGAPSPTNLVVLSIGQFDIRLRGNKESKSSTEFERYATFSIVANPIEAEIPPNTYSKFEPIWWLKEELVLWSKLSASSSNVSSPMSLQASSTNPTETMYLMQVINTQNRKPFPHPNLSLKPSSAKQLGFCWTERRFKITPSTSKAKTTDTVPPNAIKSVAVLRETSFSILYLKTQKINTEGKVETNNKGRPLKPSFIQRTNPKVNQRIFKYLLKLLLFSRYSPIFVRILEFWTLSLKSLLCNIGTLLESLVPLSSHILPSSVYKFFVDKFGPLNTHSTRRELGDLDGSLWSCLCCRVSSPLIFLIRKLNFDSPRVTCISNCRECVLPRTLIISVSHELPQNLRFQVVSK
ncbi:putative dihydrouridine synthase [Cryptosporidium felis]|nr:putative dihydrouridine synthase [Cryptosporidium felis]